MEKLWEEMPEKDKGRIRKTLEYNELNICFLREVFSKLGKRKEHDAFLKAYEEIMDVIPEEYLG